MTLDRFDTTTRLGIQVGLDKLSGLDRSSPRYGPFLLTFFDAPPVDVTNGFFTRYEPYGQYVFRGHAAGVYGHIPISHFFDSSGADATAVGDADLGVFFMPTYSSALVLRAGIALPTASSDTSAAISDGAMANGATMWERVTDAVLVSPHYTTLRFSASRAARERETSGLFFRGDLGLDFVVTRSALSLSPVVFIRGNLALGIRASAVDVTFELANLASVNVELGTHSERRFMDTAGISLRTHGENQLHFGTVFPLNDEVRGKIWVLSAGYQRAMNL